MTDYGNDTVTKRLSAGLRDAPRWGSDDGLAKVVVGLVVENPHCDIDCVSDRGLRSTRVARPR